MSNKIKSKFIYLTEDEVIDGARSIMESRLIGGTEFVSSKVASDYCSTQLWRREHEVFLVLFLNSKRCLIDSEEISKGTINCSTVYPREVVKSALRRNASACILSHNHPSGCVEPSAADKRLTQRLKEALELIDVIVLDHIIVGSGKCLSFAEKGLL